MTNAARLTDYKKASVSAAFGAGVPVIKNHTGGAARGTKGGDRTGRGKPERERGGGQHDDGGGAGRGNNRAGNRGG